MEPRSKGAKGNACYDCHEIWWSERGTLQFFHFLLESGKENIDSARNLKITIAIEKGKIGKNVVEVDDENKGIVELIW